MINYLYAHLYVLFKVLPVQHSPDFSQDWGQLMTKSHFKDDLHHGVSQVSPARVWSV